MITRTFVSAIVLTSVLGFSAPALAQDHVIDGKAVPADEVEAVQAKCDELRDAAGTDGTATDTAAPTAEAGAAETTDATTSTDSAADPATTSTDTATTEASAPVIDLETLTIAMCDQGGFTASTP